MKVLEKKTVWEGGFLRTVLLAYRDHSGNLRNWEAVERVNCRGVVVIVPVTAGKEAVLTRQFRPVLNNFVVEFPAGLNDKGETLVEAARRELIEETGYASEEFVHLAEGPVSSGISTEVLTVFLAKDIVPAPPELKRRYPPDETEDIQIIKTPVSGIYEELKTFEENGDLIDLKIYGLVELAKRRL